MADESASNLPEQVEALRRRVEEKSGFLCVIHEIRSLLTAILGYADLPASSDISSAERDSYLQVIQHSSENLLALIGNILDFSRIETGGIAIEKSDCCPYRVLDEVVSQLRPRAAEQGLDFEVQHVPPLPKTIRTDPARLRQILATLIGGAVDHTRQGSICVTIRCIADGDLLRMQVEIANTGISLTPEEKAGLFEPFRRPGATTSHRFAGMELRLYVSKRLAEMLGGDIEVENRPGEGCLFTLTIDPGPLEGVGMLRSPPVFLPRRCRPAESGRAPMLHGTILLAKDDRNLRGLLQMVLSKAGLEVDPAENGRVAYQKASASTTKGNPYDLILMDIQMPELDGYETARRLRRDGWPGPIVALTAHVLPGDRQKCLDAGCNDYIPKPVDWTTLLNTIAGHLGQEAVSAEPPASEEELPGDGSKPLGNGFINDDTMADLLDAFAAELPDRATRIENALRDGDFRHLDHFSHQLKGAAAVYGFDRIAMAADRVHKLAGSSSDHEQLPAAVDKLVDLCRRAQQGC